MIIKKLNLLSFGKLKNKEITLSDNLNVIYGANESGKSTISAFIEAMLYSYPSHDKDRTRYFPWDKTAPSGTMTIRHNSKDYTIYRTFGTTPKADSLQTEPQISLYDIIPDRETFRKSMYCAEGKAADFGKTSGMDARIANIMASGDENINAQEAIEYLSEQRKRYIRQRSNAGELQQAKIKLTDLENELAIAHLAENDLASRRADINNKEETISTLKEQIATLENSIVSYAVEDNELGESISQQKDYIASLSPIKKDAAGKKTSVKYPVLYTICTLVLFIIGFLFFKPLMFVSPLPVLAYLLAKLFTKQKNSHNTQENDTSVYKEALADLDKLREDKAKVSEKITLTHKKISELQKNLLSEQEALHALEKMVFDASYRSIDEIETELAYTKKLCHEMSVKVCAIDAAIEAIGYAAERFSEDFTPAVSKKAMEYLSLIAPKEARTVSLVMDAENKKNPLSISVKDPLPRNLMSFSFGFRQEVYLCFRIALSEFLYDKDFPIILDDPFLGSDDMRENAIIDLLHNVAKKRQVIVFTNRKNEHFNQLNCNFVDIGQ